MEKYIHPCSQLPSINEAIGSSCMTKIAQRYKFVKVLGTGTVGMAIQVKNNETGKFLVVKIVPLDTEAVNEIQTQCLLSELKNKTGIFVTAYGWQVCEDIPDEWDEQMEDNDFPETWDAPDKILCIFMEETSKRLTDYQLTPVEKKAVAFILLHGLYVARKELEFSHDDIHEENIMLQPRDSSKTPVSLSVGNVTFQMPPRIRVVPKLIDYGYSTTKYTTTSKEDEDEDEDDMFSSHVDNSTDIGSLGFVFPEIESIIESARSTAGSDYKSIRTILMSTYFAAYRDKENKLVGERCLVCMSPAMVQYKNRAVDTFCDLKCGQKYWI